MNSKKLLYFGLILVALACSDDEQPSRTELLTGNWYVTSETPSSVAGCGTGEPYVADDTYAFWADGTFTYDHGAITEGTGNCSNFINLEGTWTFHDNESRFLVTIDHSPEYPERDLKGDTLILAKIKSLEAEKLVLTLGDGTQEMTMSRIKK